MLYLTLLYISRHLPLFCSLFKDSCMEILLKCLFLLVLFPLAPSLSDTAISDQTPFDYGHRQYIASARAL